METQTALPQNGVNAQNPHSGNFKRTQSDELLSPKNFDVARWLIHLSNSLAMARGIKIAEDRFAFFLMQLAEFTPEQAAGAQAWIIRGDWTFKGARGTVELADFYPTTAQLETVKTPDTRLLTSDELRRVCEQYREYGRQDERERLAKYESDLRGGHRVFNNNETLSDNLNAEVSALRLLLGKLRTQHAALVLKGFSEMTEFEDWYAEVNKAVIEIARHDHKRRAFLSALSAEL